MQHGRTAQAHVHRARADFDHDKLL